MRAQFRFNALTSWWLWIASDQQARAIIGAHSHVTKDVEPYPLIYGISARKHEDAHGLLEKILPRFE